MNYRAAGLVAALLASTAYASETPLYDAPAKWVEVADLAKAAPLANGPVLIRDVQIRAEDGRVTTYSDIAIRIDSPQALTQFGTLTAQWLPDKGDITIHRASLVRDNAEIDLLKDARFTVLQRERELEQRTLTGMLTATMPVAGARIGDVLRLSFTVSVADQALLGEVQDINAVPFVPIQPGLGRLRVSWPEDEAVKVSGGPRLATPEPTRAAGYNQVEVSLNRAKPEEMPGDAPGRYHAPSMVALSSFADWQQVSRTMAPLYATEETISAGGPIASEIVRIAAESDDPKVRAAAALRLVQDRIAYLADGMNGGNYIPQSPEKTWETRYGDCKAKTLLLMAMLRELGIEAQPLLVSTSRGDAVAEVLPMPAAFDHVIVHAKAGGNDLWLDGTSSGTVIEALEDAPPHVWGLPLTREGAGLIRIPSAPPTLPTLAIVNRIDLSAGVDFPALYDATLRLSGPSGAMLQPLTELPASEQKDDLIDQIVRSVMGPSEIIERGLTFDQATRVTTVRAKGMAGTYFSREEKRAEYAPNLPSVNLQFDGNRSRAAWREIPVALASPDRVVADITVELPPLAGYTLSGGTLAAAAAGATVDRKTSLDGSTLHIVEHVATAGGELAPAEIAAERARFATLTANPLRLKAPADAPRSWDPAKHDPAKLKAIEAAYGKLIADNPTVDGYLFSRASFYSGIRDHKRAIADLDKAVAIDESAGNLAARAGSRVALGDFAGAADDAARAVELEPGGAQVAELAQLLGLAGRAAEALPLVESALDQGGDSTPSLIVVKAELLARLARAEEGRAAIAEIAADRPGDADMLNSLCWHGGLWQVGLDTLAADCDAAVTAASYAPAVLDSRALANFRLGKLDEALADANAAQGRNPGQEQTLLLRGVIRMKAGDQGGASDVAEALRRRPGLKAEYAGYGLLPAK